MDSHQAFGCGVTDAGISYSSYPEVPLLPNRLFGSLKFEIGNSPCSPFSNQFDCDTVTSLSNSPEQLSSTENLSGVSPSPNSSLGSNSYIQQTNPSVKREQEISQLFSGELSLLIDENCTHNIKYTLQQLETALMGPDDDEDVTMPIASIGKSSNQENHGSHVIQPQPSYVSRHRQSSEGANNEKRQKVLEEETVYSNQTENLKQLLIACAKALTENNIIVFDKLVEKARGAVSITGEPIQRLGAYLIEGLVARKESSGANIYHALECKQPESKDLLSYLQIMYEICPYLKFGYMAANGAIAEACRNEDRVHIIDFQIAQGTQWITLLQALAATPGGPPHVRITGIDDPVSKYARGDGLEAVGRRLAAVSQKFNIAVEFHGVPVFAHEVTPNMLDVRPGEALAVNFPLQLHHIPDESVDVNNPRDGLLRMVKSLNPKVTTLVEQESNTNTTPFLNRFRETLDYYLAMFELIDTSLQMEQKAQVSVEEHCLARDMVNVIACEGRERVERHELFGKWKSRFTMAGFRQYPLSSYINSVIRYLLRCYSEHYTLVEKDGAMLLRWKERNLVSASAWH